MFDEWKRGSVLFDGTIGLGKGIESLKSIDVWIRRMRVVLKANADGVSVHRTRLRENLVPCLKHLVDTTLQTFDTDHPSGLHDSFRSIHHLSPFIAKGRTET